MEADIASPNRAEDRVGQSVKADIGIRMTGKSHAMRDLDAAYPEMIAGRERVNIEALPDPDIASPGSDQPFSGGEIFWSRDF